MDCEVDTPQRSARNNLCEDSGIQYLERCEEIILQSFKDANRPNFFEENNQMCDPSEKQYNVIQNCVDEEATPTNNECNADKLVEYNSDEMTQINYVSSEYAVDGEGNHSEEENVRKRKATPTEINIKDPSDFTAIEIDEKHVSEMIKNDDQNETIESIYHDLPTSTTRSAFSKENTVDENQCRICTSKEDLLSLFTVVDKLTPAEMLRTISSTVTIASKDFMPQCICGNCLKNLKIAIELKTLFEATERELRKRLSRHKNKLRRPLGYVVIDASAESDPVSEEDPNDDVEFKVSDIETSASPDNSDTEDSDFSVKKKRKRSTTGRRRRFKSSDASTERTKKTLSKIKPTSNESTYRGDESQPHKKKRSIIVDKNYSQNHFSCDECDQIFGKKHSLVLHKRVHYGEKNPIECEICGKQFKMQSAYKTHLEKHKEDDVLGKKHDNTANSENKFTRHKQRHSSSIDSSGGKLKKNDLDSYALGQDLFKDVAPLTTTYWSDSFSD